MIKQKRGNASTIQEVVLSNLGVESTDVVDLPDESDEKDAGAVLDCIREHWVDFQLLAGSYVLESDELDGGAEVIVTYEDGSTISHGSPDEFE